MYALSMGNNSISIFDNDQYLSVIDVLYCRSAAPSIQQRQLPFVQQRSHQRLQHNGGGYGGDGKIYVTRRPRYLSSVRRSGHGYASFFCGGKGCKSWGYTFRA